MDSVIINARSDYTIMPTTRVQYLGGHFNSVENMLFGPVS